jgi:hypothetical protein
MPEDEYPARTGGTKIRQPPELTAAGSMVIWVQEFSVRLYE